MNDCSSWIIKKHLLFSGALHPRQGEVPEEGCFLLLDELCPVYDALSGGWGWPTGRYSKRWRSSSHCYFWRSTTTIQQRHSSWCPSSGRRHIHAPSPQTPSSWLESTQRLCTAAAFQGTKFEKKRNDILFVSLILTFCLVALVERREGHGIVQRSKKSSPWSQRLWLGWRWDKSDGSLAQIEGGVQKDDLKF